MSPERFDGPRRQGDAFDVPYVSQKARELLGAGDVVDTNSAAHTVGTVAGIPLGTGKVKAPLAFAKGAGKGANIDRWGNKLGPSGKPLIHVVKHPTRKRAKDAARNEGSGAPVHHPSPVRGGPHFHPSNADRTKQPGSPHHEYPR